jgi:hypothetical protein
MIMDLGIAKDTDPELTALTGHAELTCRTRVCEGVHHLVELSKTTPFCRGSDPPVQVDDPTQAALQNHPHAGLPDGVDPDGGGYGRCCEG